MPPSPRDKPSVVHRQGFSLLELAVVTVIVSGIAASGLVLGRATIESAQVAATNQRMNVIETALYAYRLANDRLPCPSSLSLTAASAQYGVEAANPGTCTGGAPAANFTFTSGASTVVEGGVPVRALNLPDEFMYDGWGRRFVYSVWAPITAGKGFVNYGVTPNCGMTSVRNTSGAARTNRGLYTLYSTGNNGHGGYNVSGQRVAAASVNADEYINCHCNASAANTGYLATYVQKDYAESATNTLDAFDDIVRFKERWQLQSYFDEYNPGGYLVCPTNGPGSRSYGTVADDNVGVAQVVGDVNADGFDDLIIGVPRQTSGISAGSVAVVFGTASGIPNPILLSALDGTNGFWINSGEAADWAGSALATGDMNNDGILDIIIGAPRGNADNGRIYVVYGHVNPWTTPVSLAGLPVAEGFQVTNDIVTATPEKFGSSLATGDVNIDGYTDIIIGAPEASTNRGAVYTIRGKSSAWAATNNVSAVMNSVVTGSTNDRSGTAVLVMDVNADRVPDIVIGMPGDGVAMTGQVNIVYGRRHGLWNIGFERLYGKFGYKVLGDTAGSRFGASLAKVDVNGDLIVDLLVGAPNYSTGAGAAYIVFGNTASIKPIRWRANTTLLNGKIGARITGINAGDNAGAAVAGADLNGDGIGDIIVGAPNADPSARASAGTVYVMFGKKVWGTTISLSTLNGTTGFMLDGSTAGDVAGTSLSVGDANRDYVADIFIGSPLSDYNAVNAGTVYTFYGQRRPAPWTLNVDLNSL